MESGDWDVAEPLMAPALCTFVNAWFWMTQTLQICSETVLECASLTQAQPHMARYALRSSYAAPNSLVFPRMPRHYGAST
jgi:hypothetical protein